MTWLLDHYGKGFCCWLYLACVASVKRGRGGQSAGRRRGRDEKVACLKKPNWRLECKSRTLFMTKMETKWLKSIPNLWPKRLKNLCGRTYLYSPYKGLPPPPPPRSCLQCISYLPASCIDNFFLDRLYLLLFQNLLSRPKNILNRSIITFSSSLRMI